MERCESKWKKERGEDGASLQRLLQFTMPSHFTDHASHTPHARSGSKAVKVHPRRRLVQNPVPQRPLLFNLAKTQSHKPASPPQAPPSPPPPHQPASCHAHHLRPATPRALSSCPYTAPAYDGPNSRLSSAASSWPATTCLPPSPPSNSPRAS